MKSFRIEQKYDEDLFNDIIQITENNNVLYSVTSKEGNLLESLKNKIQKEYIVHSGYLGAETAYLKSNFVISSSWEFVIGKKEIAKAEIKGLQYFTVKLSDGKQSYSGKTTDLTQVELKKDRDFGTCITVKRENGDKLAMDITIDCKVSPEALLTLAIAFDNKRLLEIK